MTNEKNPQSEQNNANTPTPTPDQTPVPEEMLASKVEEPQDEQDIPAFLLEGEEDSHSNLGDKTPGAESAGEPPTETKKAKPQEIISRITDFIKENKKLVLLGAGGFLILLIILVIISLVTKPPRPRPGLAPTVPAPAPTKKVTLTMWGLWYPQKVMEELIAEYENQNPNVQIKYVKQDFMHTSENVAYDGAYYNKAKERITQVGGVDIIEIHYSWLELLKDYLQPADSNVLSETEAQRIFYKGIAERIIQQNKVIGLPIFADAFVMFYNPDRIPDDVISQIVTWDDLIQLAETIKNRGGAGIGTFQNVFHSPELFLLLLTQTGVTPYNNGSFNLKNVNAYSALNFYLRFFTDFDVWNPQKAPDLKGFAQCQTAIIFAPSYRYINFINSNKELKLKIAPVPVFGGASADRPQHIGTFYLFVVPKNSPNAKEAWKFLAWLNKPENLQKIAQAQKETMGISQTFARKDLKQQDTYHQVVQNVLEKAVFVNIPTFGLWETKAKEILSDAVKDPLSIETTVNSFSDALNEALQK